MVKIVSGSFVDDGIYGYVRDEKRKLEVTSVAGDMAGDGRKLPKTAAHFSPLFAPSNSHHAGGDWAGGR